jgi:hypothetical protein
MTGFVNESFGNTNFLFGVAKGSASLLRHSIFAVSNSFTQILEAVIKGINFLSGEISLTQPTGGSSVGDVFAQLGPENQPEFSNILYQNQQSIHRTIHQQNTIWFTIIVNQKSHYLNKKKFLQNMNLQTNKSEINKGQKSMSVKYNLRNAKNLSKASKQFKELSGAIFRLPRYFLQRTHSTFKV